MNTSNTQTLPTATQSIMDRIGLGSVQFGIDYGITNTIGKVGGLEVERIAKAASKTGVNLIDTACEYGNSEAVIGHSFSKNGKLKIITKTPTSKHDTIDFEFCEQIQFKFKNSLAKLRVNQVYGLLVHHANDILKPGGDQLVSTLLSIRDKAKAKKIGVSVYNAAEIDAVIELFIPDIIQLPLNILDQRLINSGKIRKLKDMGVEIHVRSLFLQGVLLINSKNLPAFFSPVQKHFENIEKLASDLNLTKLELCLLFGLSIEEVDILIIGITSLNEFFDLQKSCSNLTSCKIEDMSYLSINEEKYINPALWPL